MLIVFIIVVLDDVGRKLKKVAVPEKEIRNELALARSRERASFSVTKLALSPTVRKGQLVSYFFFRHRILNDFLKLPGR